VKISASGVFEANFLSGSSKGRRSFSKCRSTLSSSRSGTLNSVPEISRDRVGSMGTMNRPGVSSRLRATGQNCFTATTEDSVPINAWSSCISRVWLTIRHQPPAAAFGGGSAACGVSRRLLLVPTRCCPIPSGSPLATPDLEDWNNSIVRLVVNVESMKSMRCFWENCGDRVRPSS
jgi:hypothetical protein